MIAITTTLVTHSGVNDIFIAEDQYAIVATNSGVDVISLLSQEVVSSGVLPFRALSVAANFQWREPRLFVGTSGGGIYSTAYENITQLSDFTSQLIQHFTTATSPPISGNVVFDLDAYRNRLLVSTSGGVDFILNGTQYSTRHLGQGSSRCRLTTVGSGYWVNVSGGVEVNYTLSGTVGSNVLTPDFSYKSGGLTDPELPSEPVLDLTISEVSGYRNTLGFSTASGVLLVEEVPGDESTSQRRTLVADQVSVSADFHPGALYESGCIYITTASRVQTVDLSTDASSSAHTVSQGSRGQTLVTGTVNLVRTTIAGSCP